MKDTKAHLEEFRHKITTTGQLIEHLTKIRSDFEHYSILINHLKENIESNIHKQTLIADESRKSLSNAQKEFQSNLYSTYTSSLQVIIDESARTQNQLVNWGNSLTSKLDSSFKTSESIITTNYSSINTSLLDTKRELIQVMSKNISENEEKMVSHFIELESTVQRKMIELSESINISYNSIQMKLESDVLDSIQKTKIVLHNQSEIGYLNLENQITESITKLEHSQLQEFSQLINSITQYHKEYIASLDNLKEEFLKSLKLFESNTKSLLSKLEYSQQEQYDKFIVKSNMHFDALKSMNENLSLKIQLFKGDSDDRSKKQKKLTYVVLGLVIVNIIMTTILLTH